MESVLDRAARVLAQHPAPALPLDELRRLVRGSGVGVAEEALLRALRRGSDRFRLVDPWRGPWGPLRGRRGHGGWAPPCRSIAGGLARRTPGRRPGGPAHGHTHGRRGTIGRRTGRRGGEAADGGPVQGIGSPWVVARPSASGPAGRGGLRRLRQSLAHLGWTVDDHSPLDMARWCLLLREEDRVRRRARAPG